MGGLVSAGPVTAQDVEAVAANLATLSAARIRVWPGTTDRGAWLEADLPPLAPAIPDHARRRPARGPGGPPVLESRNTLKRVRKGERFFDVEHDDTGRLLPVFQDLLRRSVDVWAEERPLAAPPPPPAGC